MTFRFGQFGGLGLTADLTLRGMHVDLEPAVGGLMLILQAEASHTGLRAGTTVLFTGDVRIAAAHRPLLGVIQHAERGGPLVLKSFPLPVWFSVPVGYDALDAVEVLRQGGDLDLAVGLHALLLQAVPSDDSSGGAHEAGPSPGDELQWPVASAQLNVHVTSGDWVRRLEQIETAAGFLVAARAPRDGGRRAEAVAILRTAKKLLADGLYAQAVAEARKVLDILHDIAPAPTVPAGKPQERTAEQRWAVFREAVKGLANAAPHADPVAAEVSWSRDEAVTVIAAIAGLLERCD